MEHWEYIVDGIAHEDYESDWDAGQADWRVLCIKCVHEHGLPRHEECHLIWDGVIIEYDTPLYFH